MTHSRMQTIKIFLSAGVGKLPRVVDAPVSPALNQCAVSIFPVSEGVDPFTMSSFSNRDRRSEWSLHDLQTRWFFRRSCRMSSPSSDVVASLSLGPLVHWCLPVSPDVSFRTPVRSGFLVQPCPCLVSDNSVPYAVQEWHAVHPSVGGGQLLLGPTIALGAFLLLAEAPYV
jgi:hypothetical protein